MTDVLKLSAKKNSQFGADDYLPLLQYLVLKYCPPNILMNLNFISTYISDSKKLS